MHGHCRGGNDRDARLEGKFMNISVCLFLGIEYSIV